MKLRGHSNFLIPSPELSIMHTHDSININLNLSYNTVTLFKNEKYFAKAQKQIKSPYHFSQYIFFFTGPMLFREPTYNLKS